MSTLDYQRLINQAIDLSLLDWDTTGENRYTRSILRLHITVWLDRQDTRWYWMLSDERSGRTEQGASDSREVAKREALAYAQHWVKQLQLAGAIH